MRCVVIKMTVWLAEAGRGCEKHRRREDSRVTKISERACVPTYRHIRACLCPVRPVIVEK